jgi:hypothetical protein
MRPHEPDDLRDRQQQPRQRDYALFFFQHDGGRSYLRFTLLGVIASALLFVVPLAALLILYFFDPQGPGPRTNVNVSVLPSPPPPNTPYFQLPPSRPLPTPRPPPRMPPPPTLEPLNSNAPELVVIPTPGPTPQPTPKPTPKPTPSPSPP